MTTASRHSRADGNPEKLITDNIDIWTSAIKTKSAAGRGSRNKLDLYGIKKLRELILNLAVRGLLVPQDPNDEPASVLLEKIAQEKAKLLKAGKIKKQKPLSEIGEGEKPLGLPKTWCWQRVTDVFYPISVSKNKVKTSEIQEKGKVPVVDQGQSYVAGYVDLENLEIKLPGPVIVFGDHTSALKYIDFNFIAGADGVKILRPICCSEQYFYLVSQTLSIENRGYGRHYSRLIDNFFPLPPLKEQHRIVTKVDELMALCDQLEQQQSSSLNAHQTLVQTLLGALTTVSEREGFTAAWSRIAAHFDTLFTTENSIDQLKQTILQLAVMGKLVPQDPNDEPASLLLEKIVQEKSKLIKAGKIKKQKALPEIGENEKPFDFPVGWEWCKLDDVSLHSEAGWSPRCEPTPREGLKWGVLKVSAVTWGKFNPNENKELPSDLDPRPEYEVKANDFLISRANTAQLVAKAVIVPADVPACLMMSDKIIRFVFSESVFGDYISLFNNAEVARNYYARVAGGTSSSMKNVSREQIRNLVLSLPPLAEQHRIVTKVNELMTLCDTLKARLNSAQTTQLQLADSLAEQAVG